MYQELLWSIPLPEAIPFPIDLHPSPISVILASGDICEVSAFASFLERSSTVAAVTEGAFAVLKVALSGELEVDETGRRVANPAPVRDMQTHVLVTTAVEETSGLDLDYTELFEIAIDRVRDMQLAYHLATGDPVSMVANELLPPIIPVAAGVGPERAISAFCVSFASVRAGAMPDELDSQQRISYATFLEVARSMAFDGYVDSRREAKASLTLRGDYRGSVLAAATASELLIDTSLQLLYWESGTVPIVAAQAFVDPKKGAKSRFYSEFKSKVGGNWGRTSQAVLLWEEDVLDVRNRVIHRGYKPSLLEARAAYEACVGLETFVGDQLASAASRGKWIATAYSLCGTPGLGRRNALTRNVSAEVALSAERWRTDFFTWRERFASELDSTV